VCRSRLASLEAGSARVRSALRSADFPAPHADEWQAVLAAARTGGAQRRRVRVWRTAAGGLLVLASAAALATAPVRAWVAERWATIAGDGAPASVGSEPADPGRAALAFQPDGPTLEIAIETSQAGGVLSVRFTGAASARATVTDGGTEQLAVGGHTLRIANDAGSRATYDIVLPARVDRVSVRIGARAPIAVSRAEGLASFSLRSGQRVRNEPPRDEHR
jgi:hypothetical protein